MFRHRLALVVKPSRSSLVVRMPFILRVTLAVTAPLIKPSPRRRSLRLKCEIAPARQQLSVGYNEKRICVMERPQNIGECLRSSLTIPSKSESNNELRLRHSPRHPCCQVGRFGRRN